MGAPSDTPPIPSMTPKASGHVVEPLEATRVVAAPDALDAATVRGASLVLRLAADDALLIGGSIEVNDPAAIVLPDTGWVAWRMEEAALRQALRSVCSFDLRAGLNQGMVAGLPAKVWLDGENSMVIVAAAFGAELEERLG